MRSGCRSAEEFKWYGVEEQVGTEVKFCGTQELEIFVASFTSEWVISSRISDHTLGWVCKKVSEENMELNTILIIGVFISLTDLDLIGKERNVLSNVLLNGRVPVIIWDLGCGPLDSLWVSACDNVLSSKRGCR